MPTYMERSFLGSLCPAGANPFTAPTAGLVHGCIVAGRLLYRVAPRHDVVWLSWRPSGLTRGEALSIRQCDSAATRATPTPARDTRPPPPLHSVRERLGGRHCSA